MSIKRKIEFVLTRAALRRPTGMIRAILLLLLASYSLDAQAVDRLAALYREARFSDHAMGETDREAAVAALDAIHESLRANADMAAIA